MGGKEIDPGGVGAPVGQQFVVDAGGVVAFHLAADQRVLVGKILGRGHRAGAENRHPGQAGQTPGKSVMAPGDGRGRLPDRRLLGQGMLDAVGPDVDLAEHQQHRRHVRAQPGDFLLDGQPPFPRGALVVPGQVEGQGRTQVVHLHPGEPGPALLFHSPLPSLVGDGVGIAEHMQSGHGFPFHDAGGPAVKESSKKAPKGHRSARAAFRLSTTHGPVMRKKGRPWDMA